MGDPDKYFAIIFAIGGIPCFISFFKILYFYKVTLKTWHTTNWVIVFNDIEYEDQILEGGWKNDIGYTYTVGDTFIKCANFSRNIGFLHFSEKAVIQNEKYPVGKAITIYYNPKNPYDSIIDIRFSLNNLIYILFGCISLPIAYYIWN